MKTYRLRKIGDDFKDYKELKIAGEIQCNDRVSVAHIDFVDDVIVISFTRPFSVRIQGVTAFITEQGKFN